ncbi:MAG: SctK family type III secretion system sorting platform protein [Planctomycetaceae bacterium]|nr:SctK family type III secretion system sorting platform protein [Planctomycetaceae bacterium]
MNWKSIATSCPDLVEAICTLNHNVANTMHRDHWPEIPGPVFLERLLDEPRSRRYVNRYVLEVCGLNSSGFWEFEPRPRRLALLSEAEIHSIGLFAGAAILSPEIARTIDGQQIRQFIQAIGERIYEFAVKQAPFFQGVPAMTSDPNVSSQKLEVRVKSAGRTCLAACLVEEPAELMKRLDFKLPKDFALTSTALELSIEEKERCWGFVHRFVLREAIPERLTWFI